MAGKPWRPPRKTKSKPPRYLCRGGPLDATHLNMAHEGTLTYKLGALRQDGKQTRKVVRSGDPLPRVRFDGGSYVFDGIDYQWQPD